MPAREEFLLQAIDIVNSGSSIDIMGDHGVGRSNLLGRVHEHYEARGWQVLKVSGTAALRHVPMSALSWLGVNSSNGASALSDIRKLLNGGTGALITVDDWDDVDDISWGVLTRARAETGVPIITARLHGTDHQRGFVTTGFVDVYQMRLPTLRVDELELTLERAAGVTFEAATMSNIFALTGGNIGLALALYHAARRAGRLQVNDGVATAVGDLWTPAMSTIAEAILRPLTVEQKSGVEAMAMMGPAPLTAALKVMSREVLEELGDKAMLDLYPGADVHVVAVRQPLLISYFRNQSHNIRRLLVSDDITERLSGGNVVSIKPVQTREHAAMFVTLVNEHERRRVMVAHEAWESSRTKGTAAALLQAMSRAGESEEAIARVVRESLDIPGTREGILAWERWYSKHLAYVQQERAAAVQYLRRRAEEDPSLAPWFLSWEVALRPGFEVGDPLNDLPDESGQLPEAVWELRRARAFVLLATGDVEEALALLEELRKTQTDPHTDAMSAVAYIACGDFCRAADIGRTGLQEAAAEFDSGKMFTYAYIGAFAGILSARLGDAEEAISKVSQLASPPDEVLPHLGVTALASAIAAKRGGVQADLPRSPLSGLGIRGSLPGLQHEWVEVEKLKAQGRTREAGDILFDLGNELWARGLRLAAAYCYIIGAEAYPHEKFVEALVHRVTLVTGRALDQRRRFSLANIEHDIDVLRALAIELEQAEEYALALKTWNVVIGHAQQDGNTVVVKEASARIENISDTMSDDGVGLRVSKPAPALTEREREVARLAASGLSNPEIAKMLFVTTRTVESHILRAMRKTGVASRRELREFFRPAQ